MATVLWLFVVVVGGWLVTSPQVASSERAVAGWL